MYNQNVNDAQPASLSVLSYSILGPRWRRRIITCVFSQIYVRFDIVKHVFQCFKKSTDPFGEVSEQSESI